MSEALWLPGFGPRDGEVRLEAEVIGVTWSSEATGFAVLRLSPSPGQIVIAVGSLAHLRPGEAGSFVGTWHNDPTHGPQLKVRSALVRSPGTPEGLVRYLASGLAPGVGKGLATRLVETLGAGLVPALEGDENALAAVHGISRKKARALMAGWAHERDGREALIRLEGAGVGPGLARRIQKRYGAQTLKVLRDDPYRLAEEVRGVGFLRADALARALGMPGDSPGRGRAVVLHLLRRAVDQGHCALPAARLAEKAQGLDVPEAVVQQGLEALIEKGSVVVEPHHDTPLLYLGWMWRAEADVAERLLGWAEPEAASADPDAAIDEAERHLGFALGGDQRRAVGLAMSRGAMIITGGPGTGKTTLVKALAALFAGIPGGLALAAPTGRAAKRLMEITGAEASTLHRLLEVRPPGMDFGRHPGNPLEAGAVLVDEASMIPLPLFRGLLRGMRPGARLILVGDADQLPPVGAGEVFRDLVETEALPVVRLGTLYRQAQGSLIAANAHRIVEGKAPVVLKGEAAKGADFFIIEARQREMAQVIADLVSRRLPQAFGLDPLNDIQVLTPGHKGDVGAHSLNQALQARLNPDPPNAGRSDLHIRVGDRILQTRNNYERELLNGDLGIVVGAERDDAGVTTSLTAVFDGQQVTLKGAELDDVKLAWAMTVHKSQGSEYPAVVMAVSNQHTMLLSRNLIYTAVTRGRRLVVLVGDRAALERAIARDGRGRRYGHLKERLTGATRS